MTECIRFIEGSKPDYGFIYAKVVRHVAAAAAARAANAAADCATARLRQRDLLLQLIKDAPVVQGAQ